MNSVTRICNNYAEHSERLMFKITENDNDYKVNYCPICGEELMLLRDSMTNFSNYVGKLFENIECYKDIHPPISSKSTSKRRKKESIDENNGFNNLYHATYFPLLDSIKENGLGATKQTYWEDSKPGVVYLSADEDVATSYAEANENVPEDWLDEIVVLKIKWNSLDPNYLFIDENVQDNDGVTLEYHKIIPWSNIDIVE